MSKVPNSNNINTYRNQKGFTIVELLIVIVVIGILAAIVIVAYQGVTARANTSSNQSAAASVEKKAEAYAAEENSYPTAPSQLTGAASTKSYTLAGGGLSFVAGPFTTSAKPANTSTVIFYTCGASTGVAIGHWNYTDNAMNYVYAGSVNGTKTALPATGCTATTS